MTIAERYQDVLERVRAAAQRAQRDPEDVTVVAISKTFGLDAIAEAVAAGVTDLGENRAQELRQKVAAAGDVARWHFVGHLQTNKVRFVTGAVALLHSVDRYGLAEAVGRRARSIGTTQDVLIEVNIARDPGRHGADPGQAVHLAREVSGLGGIRVVGIMGMAPFLDDPEATRPYFKELADVSAMLRDELPEASALSMGMTRDFEVAVEEGATLVRVGEAIFGPRSA
jgi:pyridoxal phosphate enzyme (YggS family)